MKTLKIIALFIVLLLIGCKDNFDTDTHKWSFLTTKTIDYNPTTNRYTGGVYTERFEKVMTEDEAKEYCRLHTRTYYDFTLYYGTTQITYKEQIVTTYTLIK